MAWAIKTETGWEEILGGFKDLEGRQYPPGWVEGVSIEEQEAIGVVEIAETPLPLGVRVLGSTIEGVFPVRKWTFEDYSLEEAREIAWTAAKIYRDNKATSGCQTPKGRVDTTENSCLKINGAVSAAMIRQMQGQPFEIFWTMQNNSVVKHTISELLAMGLVVVAYLDSCQAAGTAIREAIENAATVEDIFAIDLEAGYPA